MSDYKFESMPENTPPPRSGGCLAGIASAFSSCLRAGRSSVVSVCVPTVDCIFFLLIVVNDFDVHFLFFLLVP